MRLHESLEETFVQTVAALAYAIDARDTYTAGHSNTVSDLAVKVANEMSLNRDLQEAIRLGGLLHDIGKIAIPDAILHKPARLTPEEYALVKTHPKVGAQILKPIKQLEYVVPIVLSHQERFDGTGYPDGLAGESIPIGARILAVVDAFSSITDNRSYRLARTEAEALSEISQWSGKQFDPEVVRAFQGLFKKRS
jgi:putative nucleotidyltransferase with HDIG domain